MKILKFTLFFLALALSASASQNKKTVKLRIQAQTGYLDETTVYFDQGIHSEYIYQEDAQKVLSGVAGVPVIYSISDDSIHCSINGYGALARTQTVPLGVSVDNNGIYNITAVLLDNLDPTSIVLLLDTKTGVSIDLRSNFYPVFLDTSDASEGRFFLRVTKPSTHASTTASCANNDASLVITCDPSITWDSYVLLNSHNDTVGSYLHVNTTITFVGLPEGVYTLVRAYGSYITTQDYYISGTYISTRIDASATQVATYENIEFSAVATHANHFVWDFGDGTIIIGVAHPDMFYFLPGVYTVNLICSNDQGCSDSAKIQITVSQSTGIAEENQSEIKITSLGKSVSVSLPDVPKEKTNIRIYNLLGEAIYSSTINTQKTDIQLSNQPTGYYLVSIKTGNTVNTKRIFING